MLIFMKLTFRPIGDDEIELTKAMKRDTAASAMGDASLFDLWFGPERPFEAFIARLREHDPDSCQFALLNGDIIGHLHLIMVDGGDCGHMTDIYLKPAYRGQGLGTQLEAQAMAFFKKYGARRAQLRTNPHNAKLIAFYERLGWVLGEPSEHGSVWMNKILA
ncbi:MAG: GNAT family N-acetyltransferase [Blastochloris viridis]|uniref:GNAT family N-acetyltransferase n=1 Tax=Blastochloris viridis TaxID=1079 RepID=A0A6N4RAH4_BLAVI|nr:MAG: GNAT family N-acetyltransferase [Blastochloris viridis]